MRRFLIVLLLGLALGLGGCAKPTKAEIIEKTREVRNRRELKDVLGSPDDIEKMAMFEQWTYECSDGKVIFHVANDKVVFRNTVGSKQEKKD